MVTPNAFRNFDSHFLCPLAVPFARRCFSTRFRTDSGKASGIHAMARLTNCTLPGARPCCLFCFSIQLRNMTNTRKRPALNKSWRCLRDGGSSNISTTLSKGSPRYASSTWTINCCFASALPAASSRGLWRICKYKAASEASCWLSSKINREQLQQGGNATSLSQSSPWMPGVQEDNDRFCLCRAFFKHRRISCSSLMRSDLKVSSRQNILGEARRYGTSASKPKLFVSNTWAHEDLADVQAPIKTWKQPPLFKCLPLQLADRNMGGPN